MYATIFRCFQRKYIQGNIKHIPSNESNLISTSTYSHMLCVCFINCLWTSLMVFPFRTEAFGYDLSTEIQSCKLWVIFVKFIWVLKIQLTDTTVWWKCGNGIWKWKNDRSNEFCYRNEMHEWDDLDIPWDRSVVPLNVIVCIEHVNCFTIALSLSAMTFDDSKKFLQANFYFHP